MSKRKKVISEAETLDAVPAGTVVLDRDEDAWQAWRIGDGVLHELEWWCADSSTPPHESTKLAEEYGPLRVLHTPG